MKEESKITTHNFSTLMPNCPIQFTSLAQMPHCPRQTMASNKTNNRIRYLTYDNIIDLMTRKMKESNGEGTKYVKFQKRWNKILQIATKMKTQNKG